MAALHAIHQVRLIFRGRAQRSTVCDFYPLNRPTTQLQTQTHEQSHFLIIDNVIPFFLFHILPKMTQFPRRKIPLIDFFLLTREIHCSFSLDHKL